jgi:hypothetical protein
VNTKVETLPFDRYVHSTDEKEYKLDKRKKAYILKYASLLDNNNMDSVSLKRFSVNMLIFRNVFCKETVINFFMKEFSEDTVKLLACVVFDIYIGSKKGTICEMKEFQHISFELYQNVNRKSIINKKWIEIKEQMPEVF